FTEVPSQKVKPPRVGESKAVFECKVKQIISLGEEGGAANLIICEVILAHFSEDILDENGKIDQQKTDWVARMGGNWYARASGEAIFEVPKPSTQRGIGVDMIPDFIKSNPLFTGNDLGRLGNIQQLPLTSEVREFRSLHHNSDLLQLAKQFLSAGKVHEAWLAILSDMQ
ncbi:MAG: flavin reductase family protein, partial [Runella zeae]